MRDDFFLFHFGVAHARLQKPIAIALEFFGLDNLAGEWSDAVFAEFHTAFVFF